MSKSENYKLIESWCDRVWGEQNRDAIYDMFAADGTAGGMGREKLAGPDEFAPFHEDLCAMLDDTCLKIDYALEDGDMMFSLATFSGTCRKTGNRVEMEGSMSTEFKDGKILHCANHFEFMTLFEQLGLLPEHSFGTLIKGKALTMGEAMEA